MKPTPVTAARLEVFEEVPTLKLPELPEAPNQKNYSVELKLALYKDKLDRFTLPNLSQNGINRTG